MPPAEQYRRQVALLVSSIPFVAEENCFALKGGTAINLFIRDLPRLSVDIDLTYLPVAGRPESLTAINAAMKRIASRIRQGLQGVHVNEVVNAREGIVTKLTVQRAGAQIKIEVTPVLRGCVYEPETRGVSPNVEDAFGFVEIQVVSFADLYAGKLVAALDRQHPRDLFDIRDLLANEGVTEELRTAFIVYLLSHDRPMAEVLAPPRKDISHEFTHGFDGMTVAPVTIEELTQVRETMIETVVGSMPDAHRRFLLSFERGEPEWELLGVDAVKDLPAVKWRQHNLDKLSAEKRDALVTQLEQVLAQKPVSTSAHQSE
ncbi:nucleotidyl transferase AbiEii/AbiGii toxin family protein [Microvirga sp. G4-2]|uniref:nucleotidyl transferase AbiEii/AbiGii toxin family protein n=1 Tax=Microvirga sp. G4-2 TaxID=3434467 RepID=UPI00404422FC